ncbi:DUF7667 family protein [Salinithrix halophila]|uniref:Uncharacterized protein n=1 Tax=Salinithrix halophila TaxID=1485204 RepID=A0ABV8JJK9_9BACL
MEPFHRRLAELYWKCRGKIGDLNKPDTRELRECLKAHFHWALELNRLEMLADTARRANDEGWEKEICGQIDKHLMSTLGGN